MDSARFGRKAPFDWLFVRQIGLHAVLATLFLVTSGRLAIDAWSQSWLGLDAQIYYRGSAAWLAGANPWETLGYFRGQEAHYAALPTTVILVAPLTLMPEWLFVSAVLTSSLAAAVYIVRKLSLPWYFIAFPPLYQGVQSGNPNVILFAFMLSGVPAVEALAPLLKVYAVIPQVLLWRRRTLVLTFVGFVASALALPLWMTYLTGAATYSSRLLAEANGGFSAVSMGPIVLVVAVCSVAALWIVDRRVGIWASVPALWPATQLHYSIFLLPVIHGRPWLAAILAVPWAGIPALVPAALLAEVAVRFVVRRWARH